MSLFDIIGPVMIGPSSSHTAGAVRIGMLARRLWGWNRPLRTVRLYLRGSFAATYWGHGTDKGIVAGLLRMEPDDLRIPNAFDVAREEGLYFTFETEEVDGAHPNSVRVVMTDGSETCEVVGASVGGGAVQLRSINGFDVKVPFDQPALIVMQHDRPGVVAAITGQLVRYGLNVAAMTMERGSRGGVAVSVFILDGEVPADLPDIVKENVTNCITARLLVSSGQ